MGFQPKASPINLKYNISDITASGQVINTELNSDLLENKDSSVMMPAVKFE